MVAVEEIEDATMTVPAGQTIDPRETTQTTVRDATGQTDLDVVDQTTTRRRVRIRPTRKDIGVDVIMVAEDADVDVVNRKITLAIHENQTTIPEVGRNVRKVQKVQKIQTARDLDSEDLRGSRITTVKVQKVTLNVAVDVVEGFVVVEDGGVEEDFGTRLRPTAS